MSHVDLGRNQKVQCNLSSTIMWYSLFRVTDTHFGSLAVSGNRSTNKSSNECGINIVCLTENVADILPPR